MADFTISIDDDVLDTLKVVAEYRKVKVEDILREIVLDDLDAINRRQQSPLIGALDKFGAVEDDVASRADDILRQEWRPD